MATKDPEKRREHNRRYYEKNRDLYLEKSKIQRERNRDWLNEIKSQPCMDCGGTFPPYVMDFDHRDPKAKEFIIALGYNTVSRGKLEAEIAKCDIVCANCHRIRTFSR